MQQSAPYAPQGWPSRLQRNFITPLRDLFTSWRTLRVTRGLILESLDAPLPADFAPNGRDVVVTVPPAAVLWRELTFPRMSRRKADAAIVMNLRQTMPAQGKGLHWRAGPARADGSRRHTPILIAKSAQIDALRKAVAAKGGRLAQIVVAGAQPISLHDNPDFAGARRLWATAAIVLLCIGALGQVVAFEWQARKGRAANAALAASIADLEAEAVTARVAIEAQDAIAKSLRSDLAAFDVGRKALLLGNLTTVLPDEVWISGTGGRGPTFVLSGFVRGDVTEVLEAIGGIGQVSSVTLNGPVTVDTRSGDRRFELTLAMKLGGR